jgi:hypothetical protein
MSLLPKFARPTIFAALFTLAACWPNANSPDAPRPPRAQKWFVRAEREFKSASVDAAGDSVKKALDLVPKDEEVRLLAAKISLARLEYDEVLRQLRGITSADAQSLRGRAYWYKGEIEAAARELDKLLDNPDIEDNWAKQISKLAHRGAGRKPFDIGTTNGRLETVQMARVAGVPLFVVPVEIDGEKALALVSTGNAEVMIDSSTRREPSWISLRFGARFEVRDVPALTQDLTEISMKLGVPIKALLGANLLRHLNATLDHRGRQFVARSFVPPPPPVASRVDVFYLRGGGMVLGSSFGDAESERTSLFVDSSMGHTIALDLGGWKKIGIDAQTLPLVPDAGQLRAGAIPMLQFGAFKLPQVPGVFGAPIEHVERELDIDIDGAVGAGLLAAFRLTFSDHGRVLWVEQRPPTAPSGGATLQAPSLTQPNNLLNPLPGQGSGSGQIPGLGGGTRPGGAPTELRTLPTAPPSAPPKD